MTEKDKKNKSLEFFYLNCRINQEKKREKYIEEKRNIVFEITFNDKNEMFFILIEVKNLKLFGSNYI